MYPRANAVRVAVRCVRMRMYRILRNKQQL
jgi:hypothetical protein